MALVTVTGTLGDFQGAEPGLTPRIRWKPSGSSVNGSKLLFNRAIVTLVTPSTGAWSQQFEAMDQLTPQVFLSPTIEWFETDSQGGHWVAEDHPELQLVVPAGGPFAFTAVVKAATNPTTFIWGFGPPPDNLSPGTIYYNSAALEGENNTFVGV